MSEYGERIILSFRLNNEYEEIQYYLQGHSGMLHVAKLDTCEWMLDAGPLVHRS